MAMPMLPLELSFAGNSTVSAHGLLDSGSAVNVLPHLLGLHLGAEWEKHSARVTLSGNLGAHDARALVLEARIADFPPVKLVFAWTQAPDVPLLLGQVNFFQEFDVCIHGSRRQFEVQPHQQ